MSRKFTWGKKITMKTLKHIFRRHFHFCGRGKWGPNPNDKDKVRKRVIPTLRMVMSWRYKDTEKYSDREIIEYFLAIIKYDYPEVYSRGKRA